jgi:hypothetical protein
MAVDHDLLLIVGLAMLCLSLPSLLAALIEDRVPIVAGFGLALGTVLAAWGLLGGGRGFNPANLPHVFFDVLGRYLP